MLGTSIERAPGEGMDAAPPPTWPARDAETAGWVPEAPHSAMLGVAPDAARGPTPGALHGAMPDAMPDASPGPTLAAAAVSDPASGEALSETPGGPAGGSSVDDAPHDAPPDESPVPFVPQQRRPHGVAARSGESDPAAGEASGSSPQAGSGRPEAWSPEFGPLAPYTCRTDVTDILVNGSDLWLDRGDGLERVSDWWLSHDQTRELAVQLVAAGGRHIDESTPCVDVRLRGGVRVHAVLPPIATNGPLLSIRLASRTRLSLNDLASGGMVSPEQRRVLLAAVAARRNILVTGAAGTGKTTLLAALLAEAPHSERIVVLEDVAELQIDHPHAVTLEARQANVEGAGALGVGALLRESLRMRPDRVVVGECRGPEVKELLTALGTGHDGGAGTVHANGLEDFPARLEALGALAGLAPSALARQAVAAIDLVVHVGRAEGARRVLGMGRCDVDAAGRLTVTPHSPDALASWLDGEGAAA